MYTDQSISHNSQLELQNRLTKPITLKTFTAIYMPSKDHCTLFLSKRIKFNDQSFKQN